MSEAFFPPKPNHHPKIYAYEDSNPQYKGLLKVGYTTIDVRVRVAQQYPTLRPNKQPYKIVLEESAMRNDGGAFTDKDVHKRLRKLGFHNPNGEWFKCKPQDVMAAVLSLRSGGEGESSRHLNFGLRPEQSAAIQKTITYIRSFAKENPDKTPRFLWNAKMRFGKTFATYQLAKAMGWKKLLVLTFKPAVQSAWEEDLSSHVDFDGWQFISRKGLSYEEVNKKKPFVCFGSFQDYMQKNKVGGIKSRNEWVHTTQWDAVILDEYHYGAWRESAKELFEAEDANEAKFAQGEGVEYFDEDNMPITTNAYLYLSGTPFRAISTGEFIEEQIYNWTYSDEQRAKQTWSGEDNPYAALPRMVLMTYQLPEAIRQVALQGEFDAFDLNEFFSAHGTGKQARFTHANEVQKWLDLLRGAFADTTVDNLKLGQEKPPMPFSDSRLMGLLSHTFWFLPSVASCHAMAHLMKQRQNTFYKDFEVVVAAGTEAGIGMAALPPVFKAMGDPLQSKSITLSCGKLTTGVSVKPWSGIFILRNCSSPETYFQAAFRVQTPWTVQNPDLLSPHKQQVLKDECYVFDFAPDRALRQIADYSCRLNATESNPEKKVEEFINFLPVLAYDGSSMKRIDAAGILDMAMSGTTATLLARRWESALLVNVDNNTLSRLMSDAEAMKALMKIEGFRNLNQEIETIINKSDSVSKLKNKANEKALSEKQKKQLSDEEKEFKSLRKQIQDKLIKFATRVPVFMYLTDYRERTLIDIVTKLEPALFKTVTGLGIQEFNLLVSKGVFNGGLMNDAIYKFKRYEDASLSYAGIDKHAGDAVGLYNTVLNPDEYKQIFINS
jgi:hypothetical protein